ncbi:hypothetical protein A5740_04170 [Mycobacterium sp. GA-1841]|uniref:hypothetical protein n=1 Tax=Mycobacterium sp. GA-1841 TaxID=1834154 RepID=UPI00096EEC89|nr:hypothetical protein [Mycobacterium sp. GA-1841]OMC37812.1 hypothetical protein A5740_04170 [Mycobacterium sp. GA-1841]
MSSRAVAKAPGPTPDALVALRNSRLWEAHAQHCTGAERDHAVWAAAQWSRTHQMLMASTPGTRRVPLRRGAVEPKMSAGSYVYLVVVGGVLLFVLGSSVWHLFS